MTDRYFRLLEVQQKVDSLLRQALKRRKVDAFEVLSLHLKKVKSRDRLKRLIPAPSHSPVGL